MLVIGIAGGTGSGKTTVVRRIMEILPENEVAVIPQDSYYKDNSHISVEERKNINFDHPESLEFDLLLHHINQLKDKQQIERPIYSYHTCTRAEETIPVTPKKVVIVEGILLFNHKGIRDACDIKVFVDADADDRVLRVIKRDLEERGRGVGQVLERYTQTVKPMHQQFIEPTKKFADIIVPQGGENKVAIHVLASIIQMKLKEDEN